MSERSLNDEIWKSARSQACHKQTQEIDSGQSRPAPSGVWERNFLDLLPARYKERVRGMEREREGGEKGCSAQEATRNRRLLECFAC